MHDAEATVKVAERKLALMLTSIGGGSVELNGSPEGAVVRQTEREPELGKLPARLTFPFGQRLFIVSAEGRSLTQVLVTVSADETVAT